MERIYLKGENYSIVAIPWIGKVLRSYNGMQPSRNASREFVGDRILMSSVWAPRHVGGFHNCWEGDVNVNASSIKSVV